MDIEREIKVRDAIKYCIENFDSKTATNRIVEFWKDELKLQEQQCDIADFSNCADLKHELEVTDKLLAERQRVLDAIPECPSHGKCVPHAIEWIEEMKATQAKPEGYTFLGTGWVSIEEAQPKPQQKVYVVCENPKYGGGVVRFQTMAEYIPYMTVKEYDYMADEYQGIGDYNEEEDEYYTPEGFYEWQSESEMNWKISAKVTHWMPLISLP